MSSRGPSFRGKAASLHSRPKSISRHHNEWLSLVDISGPFLSTSELVRVFPQGLDDLSPELRQRLRLAHEEWLDEASKDAPDPAIHFAWVRYVFRELLGFEARDVMEGQELPPYLRVEVPQHRDTLAPSFALRSPSEKKARLLVVVEPPEQDLERSTTDRPWRASPAARMMTLLLGAQPSGGPRIGLVTNGRAFMLVHAKAGEAASYVTWSSELFFDEPLTLRAFVSLLGLKRFFNVPERDTLEALFESSQKDQQEVTDQLGAQVRRAVEVLIQTIDRVDRGRRGTLLQGIEPRVLYEAAVTVMMRLVFLLAAEERGLLLKGSALYDQSYAASTLKDQLQELADRHGEELLERRYDAWARLSATFRAIFTGIEHEDLRLPAYGGSLFDPDRFPFLEGRVPGTTFRDPVQSVAKPLAIDNRTVLHLLRAIQELELASAGGGVERRRLSFRSLGVEQIGHVYEGLLDHTAKRASEVTVSLSGKHQPEIAVSELEKKKKEGAETLSAWLADRTGSSRAAIEKKLAYRLEPEEKRKLLQACENNAEVSSRVTPWAALVRNDTHERPVILDKGAVYVTAGDERRVTGTHYTPVSLTEPIVRYTLEPLVYVGPAEGKPPSEWKLKSPREILALRVCDLAMGSGAFLVEACRYLAARVVEAWAEEEERQGHDLLVAPDGSVSIGAVGEVVIPPLILPGKTGLLPGVLPIERDAAEERGEEPPKSTRGRPSRPPSAKQAREDERLALARRYVADRCLFGVDKNPQAVEMAQLSLWLVTLQKDRPFTFVDHALVAGDSLLGITDKAQLLAFHLDPARGKEVHDLFAPKKFVEKEIDRAVKAREEIERVASTSIIDSWHKAGLEKVAREATSDLKLLGDLIVGAALASNGKDAAFDRELKNLAEKALRLFPEVGESDADWAKRKPATEKTRAELRGRAEELLQSGRGPDHPERRPHHWALVFPEVMKEGGFDAFIGNPPFQGGQRLTGALGTDYRDFMVRHLAEGRRGSADLCAYFFLRATSLLREPGMAGLIATNTIAQGDTREVGLDAMTAEGVTIPRANPSMKWPGDANLEVATVWLRQGAWSGGFVLVDKPAPSITSQLTGATTDLGKPYRLRANEGKSYIGSYVLGLGFTMSPEEAAALIERNPRNKDVLFPYLNGQDLNSHPEQQGSRWVINFFDWPLDKKMAPDGYVGPVADDYPDCLEIVRRLVKPERDANNRDVYRLRWWHYAEKRPALYAAIAPLDRVLVRARVSSYNCPALLAVGEGAVYSEQIVVIPDPTHGRFASVQSSAHGFWVTIYGSSLETRERYTPSDVFETFPFPTDLASLDSIGERYDAHRAALMKERQEGLTATYNRFHNPKEKSAGIETLRKLHVEMDEAVLRAYGWSDLDLGHDYRETKQGLRFTVSEDARVELLDRLLELNHARYAEEVKAGLHETDKKKGASKASKKPAAAKGKPTASAATTEKNPGAQMGLAGVGEGESHRKRARSPA